MKSNFLQIFKERGFLHQCTDIEALDAVLSAGETSGAGVPVYIGFDCTATSLHVGSLIQIMILRWLQKAGHKPIVLLGGATTKIGDPSGKDESRPVITDETIATNMAGIRSVFEQFGLGNAEIVNNDDWLSSIGYIQFLRDYGRHFSVNKMLSFESVKLRLEREQHLSFLEFNYMILQAYDFVALNKTHGCRLQIGGSDQWGNILNGVELQRKVLWADGQRYKVDMALPSTESYDDHQLKNLKKDNLEIFGLTTPLITTASGAKMGKSAAGAVWLSADRVSPYDYWQFWRNTEDNDVWKFMRLFTEIDIAEIARMERDMQGAAINEAKIILANAATTICHGADEAKKAEETARKVFEQGGIGDDLPTVEVKKSELDAGISAVKILQTAGLAESGGAAKRLIQGGGAKINDMKIASEAQMVTTADANKDGIIKISSGKKHHALVKVV